MIKLSFNFRLPDWVEPFLAQQPQRFNTSQERMQLAVDLARRNVDAGSGGPFGAAVFELAGGKLLSVGVNIVLEQQCSILHAEMVALALAQRRLHSFDLGAEGLAEHELVTSVEPCAMCLGALAWSGVGRVLCAGRDEDARAIGFDEGDKPADWPSTLQRRGIEVVRDVLRPQAVNVLQHYAQTNGLIYNPARHS